MAFEQESKASKVLIKIPLFAFSNYFRCLNCYCMSKSFEEASISSLAIRFEERVNSILKGQENVVRRVLATMIAGGHVLLEDNPGTGKTTFAKAIAAAVSGSVFQRVQFTPDLLPSDIVGVSVIDPATHQIRFQKGPVFTDILLADEINRASPRTQSALLEAMAERQVTIEGHCYDLDEAFFVIATQNPVEFRGTYPLPEAQMDRFSVQCSLGYVSIDEEVAILQSQRHHHPLRDLQPAISHEDLLSLREAARNVVVSDELQRYIVKLTSETRAMEEVVLPASPRASIALMRVAQALSIFEGREFLIPETIKQIAGDVIAHRLVLSHEAKFSGVTGRSIVDQLLDAIPIPV